MRYHGMNLHKRFAAVSVQDEAGLEVRYLAQVTDVAGYAGTLGTEDTVVVESSSSSF